MPVPSTDISRLRQRVQRLRASVYAQADPTGNPELLAELAQAEKQLREMPPVVTASTSTDPVTPKGRFLGPETTGLKVETVLAMNPIPTAIYPLLDPETSLDAKPKRVCVRAWLEGMSAETVRTVELKKGKSSAPLKLLPLLFPERARLVTTAQRTTLHLRVDDLDGKPESHDTFPLVMLANMSGLNSVVDPLTGEPKDLSHYYGAWVTPHLDVVQERIRWAASVHPSGTLTGYLRAGTENVRKQVAVLYQSLRDWGLAYVNAVADYGAPPGTVTQRARLPRESLAYKSANCVDGTLLFASLLEGASLSPALLLLPGHALVGWESDEGSGDWSFIETTMIGTHDFEAACASGQKQYEQAQEFYPDSIRLHRLADLRTRGIWPME
jgi:hypothetical protein